jgi:hypothetical protein
MTTTGAKPQSSLRARGHPRVRHGVALEPHSGGHLRAVDRGDDNRRVTLGHRNLRGALAVAEMMLLIALTFSACAEGTAQYEEGQRGKGAAAWLEQQRGSVVCRVDNQDLGYHDTLVMKVPQRDETNGEHLECPALLKSGLKIGAPMAIRHLTQTVAIPFEGGLAEYNKARTFPITDGSEPQLPRAVQWMQLHGDVHACIFNESGDPRTNGRTVLIRNCEGHLVFITHADIPPGTPACGQADVPACGTPSP